jgi:hypothetical protein
VPSAFERLFGTELGARLFALIAIVGGLHALLMLGLELNRFLYTESEIRRLQGELSVMNQEAEELRAILNHRHDASFREQLARLRGFVYPDELRVMTQPRAQGDSTQGDGVQDRQGDGRLRGLEETAPGGAARGAPAESSEAPDAPSGTAEAP